MPCPPECPSLRVYQGRQFSERSRGLGSPSVLLTKERSPQKGAPLLFAEPQWLLPDGTQVPSGRAVRTRTLGEASPSLRGPGEGRLNWESTALLLPTAPSGLRPVLTAPRAQFYGTGLEGTSQPAHRSNNGARTAWLVLQLQPSAARELPAWRPDGWAGPRSLSPPCATASRMPRLSGHPGHLWQPGANTVSPRFLLLQSLL